MTLDVPTALAHIICDMDEPKSQQDWDLLLAENAALRAENAQLREHVQALEAKLAQMEAKVQELQHAALRPAAPFRVRESRRKAKPKRPGRKKGHPGCCRPVPDHVDEERTVPLNCCPKCGGLVHDVEPVEQYIEEIPPVKVHVIRLVTYVGQCQRCGEVRSTDPSQVSTATGCAKVQVGPRVLALGAFLKQSVGLTYRKACTVLEHFGLRISPGGLAQAMKRVADRLEPVYEELARGIRDGPVVHVDETSWYVGEPKWWLWVFCEPRTTVYVVDESRGAGVVRRVLGDSFGGTLVSDCLSSYNPIECRKQKCYSHHLEALSDSIKLLGPQDSEPLSNLKIMLKAGMILGDMREELPPEKFRDYVANLRKSVDEVLDAVYPLTGVDKALHRFRTHREHLFTFLDYPEVDPTNNLAERQLRPAVITRKVSCGNKTKSGKRVWEVLTSIAATCRQRCISFVDLIVRAIPIGTDTPKLTPG